MTKVDYSKYPDAEVRKPRAAYTAKLQKICIQLEANPIQTITYKHWLTGSKESSSVNATSLWVVGSYARGATACGDLDLVLKHEVAEGMWHPNPSAIHRAFIGVRPCVRTYTGTPAKNDSGAVFAEAVLIWEPGMDWKSALAAIPVNPQARRFARATDCVPLRLEQSGTSIDYLTELVRLREEGVIQWGFTPVSGVASVHESEDDDEKRFLARFSQLGAAKDLLAPLILGYVRKLKAEHSAPGTIKLRAGVVVVGGTRIFANVSGLNVQALDKLGTTRLVLIPELSTRGPNGFWAIERGPNHPITKAFENTQAWTHATLDGEPVTSCCHSLNDCRATGAYFFANHEGSQADADDLNEELEGDPDAERWKYVPALYKGNKLLELLALIDVGMCPEGHDFAVNGKGLCYTLDNRNGSNSILGIEELALYFSESSLAVGQALAA